MRVHVFCPAPHIVNTYSSYCSWKNLNTQQENQHEVLPPVESLSIKFFLVCLTVSTYKGKHAKLAAILKTEIATLYISISYSLKAQQQYWWMIFSYFIIK